MVRNAKELFAFLKAVLSLKWLVKFESPPCFVTCIVNAIEDPPTLRFLRFTHTDDLLSNAC